MRKFLRPYELTVVLFYTLTTIGFVLMYQHSDYLWLIPMLIMCWFNHMFFAFNHRMVSHRSFVARSKFINNLIIFLSILQVNNSPLRFAIAHRHHHIYTDTRDDVHGPKRGFFITLIGWEFGIEEFLKNYDIKLYRDLIRDKFLLWFDKHYFKFLFVIFFIIYIVSWKLFWYVFVPAAIIWRLQANFFTNWYCHKYGYVSHLDSDSGSSRNSILGAVVTAGEGWHNNHHSNSSAYYLREKWWELDPSGLVIKYFLKQ